MSPGRGQPVPGCEFLTRLTVLILLAVVVPGCDRHTATEAASAVASDPELLASVGARALRRSDLRFDLERRRARGDRTPPRQVLDELAQREALLAHAVELGLDRDPGVIRQGQNLLIAALKERELTRADAPSPAASHLPPRNGESRRARTADTVRAPTQARLAILRQQLPPHTSAARRAAAMERLETARQRAGQLPAETAGFDSLATEFSDDDATRYHGGDLGWLIEDPSRLRHDPAMLEAGFRLREIGELSPVVEGRDGLYLVRLLGRRELPSATEPAPDEPLAAPQRAVRENREAELLRRVRERFPVRFNEAALAEFEDTESPILHSPVSPVFSRHP